MVFKTKKRSLKSDTDTIQEFQELKESISKNNPIDDQKYFSDSEATTPSSIKGKRKIKSHTSTNQYSYIIGINQ